MQQKNLATQKKMKNNPASNNSLAMGFAGSNSQAANPEKVVAQVKERKAAEAKK